MIARLALALILPLLLLAWGVLAAMVIVSMVVNGEFGRVRT